MLEGVLRGLVALLAVLGGLALLIRAVRSGARLILRAAEVTAAEGMVEISTRRGDLTTLAERQAQERRARVDRRRDGAVSLAWVLWLLLPALLDWLPAAYAIAAPLWLLPLQPVKPPEAK